MPKYDIWIEGYSFTGETPARSSRIAREIEADNFQEACVSWWESLTRRQRSGYGNFNQEKLTIFGCKLAPNRDEVDTFDHLT